MSRRIEWTTATAAEFDVYDRGADLGYDEPVTADLGLFVGSGEDGLLIEGSKGELLALLRRLIKRVEAHEPSEPITESEINNEQDIARLVVGEQYEVVFNDCCVNGQLIGELIEVGYDGSKVSATIDASSVEAYGLTFTPLFKDAR